MQKGSVPFNSAALAFAHRALAFALRALAAVTHVSAATSSLAVFVALALACAAAAPAQSQSSPQTPPAQQSAAPRPVIIRVAPKVEGRLVTHKVFTDYPEPARSDGVQGTVLLHVIIATDGSVRQIEIISGPPLLRQAALSAVKQWRYKPTLLNGVPVEVDTTVPFVFILSGSPPADSSFRTEKPPGEILGNNVRLSLALDPLLPDNLPISDAAAGYTDIEEFDLAVRTAHDLSIPFRQFRCTELGGQYCYPPTKVRAKNIEQTIRALKPSLSKSEIKAAIKAAKAESKEDLKGVYLY